MGKAYTQEEREELRIKIKECGKKIFEKDGFKNFRIKELTGEVGISLGGFYTFFESKEALYREIIDDEKKRIYIKIIEWVKEDNIKPIDFFKNVAEILPEKSRKNKLYDIDKDTPYSLTSELIFDIGENNKNDNLIFINRLREIWESRNYTLRKTNEELLGILSMLGAMSMQYNTMNSQVFETLYREIYTFVLEQI